jgi:hypothetical protein
MGEIADTKNLEVGSYKCRINLTVFIGSHALDYLISNISLGKEITRNTSTHPPRVPRFFVSNGGFLTSRKRMTPIIHSFIHVIKGVVYGNIYADLAS